MAMQSVLRSLAVLEAVAEHQPVRVGELTPLLGMPKSTVQRSLETLAEAGWLRQVDGDLTRWALTSRAQSVVLRSGGEVDLRVRDRAHEALARRRRRDDPSVRADRLVSGGGHRAGRLPPQHPHRHPAGHGLPDGGQLGGYRDARAWARRAGGRGDR